jgi:Right handed beta helix region
MSARTGIAAVVASRIAVLAAVAFAAIAMVPAVASAATVFVSNEPVKGPFNSCASPGYKGIQEAVTTNPAKTTIHVCPGEYKEQVRIEKSDTISADAGAKLQLPASPANSATSCDAATQQDLLTICGAGKVKVAGLTFEGIWPTNSCGGDQIDVYTGGGSTLTLEGSKIVHAGPELANFGCGGGLGILVGRKSGPGQAGSAKLSSDTIEGYEKNGITVDGPGSTAKISGVTIKGQAGVNVGQNGIQVSRGAKVKVKGATIEKNECGAPSCGPNTSGFKGPEEWEEAEDATGILFYEGAGGSSVKSSTISSNDIGVYNMLSAASARTLVMGNTLAANRYWGVALDEGSAKVDSNTISGPGLAGIQIVQYGKNEQFHEPKRGQEFGASGTGKSDTVSGMSKCAVEGFSDNEAGDKAGSLTLTKSLSKFSGNTTELCNNNTNGKLTISVS